MGFVNAILLFGSAAAAIPLILHLLNRSRFQKIEWGAMHLLEDIDLKNSKRLEWQSLLLLLIRVAIPVVLALCMARPILTAMKLGGDSRASVAFLLDNSFSMQASSLASQREQSNFETAKQRIDAAVDHWGRGAEFSILPLAPYSGQSDFTPNVDSRTLRKQLSELLMVPGRAAPGLAIQHAKSALDASSLTARQIVVLSDFQLSDWRSESLATEMNKLQSSIAIAWMPLQPRSTDNIEVTIDANYSEIVGQGEPFEVRVMLRNWGTRARTNLPVTLSVDQVPVAQKQVDVAADGTSQLSFAFSIQEPGQHIVTARIHDTSTLIFDDVAELPVRVLDAHRILVVRDRLEDSRYLETALQATQLGASESWLQVTRKRSNELNESIIGSANLIFLVNVPTLSDDSWRLITRQVEQGSSLIIIPGEQCDFRWYNQQTINLERGCLSAAFNQVSDSNASNASTLDRRPIGFTRPPYLHPIFALFNQLNQGRLDQVVIHQWYHLEPVHGNPLPGDVAQSESRAKRNEPSMLRPVRASVSTAFGDIVMSMNNGEPWMVLGDFGKGRIFQLATPLDATASNLPLRSVFVPWIHRLVCYSLAGPFEERPQQHPSESEPRFLSAVELERLATDCGAEVYSSIDDYAKSVHLQRDGYEIWKWFLVALLVLLIGEVWYQRWLSLRGRE